MNDPSAEREQVMIIVGTALKLNAEERELFLRSVCADDETLYKETVEALEWGNQNTRVSARTRLP